MISFFQRYKKHIDWFVRAMLYLGVVMPIVVGVKYLFPFVFPKAVFFQACVEIALLGYLALVLIDKSYLPKINALVVLVGAWMASICLAGIMGVDPSFSFWSKAERMDGILWYFHAFAFFVMLIGMMRTKMSWIRFLQWNSIVGGAVGIAALISKYAPGMFALGDQTRLAGTFGNPAFLATYFVVLFFIDVLLFASADSDNHVRRVWFVLALFSMMCVFLSGTRGAYVGVVAGIIVALVGIALSAWQKYKKIIAIIAGIGIVLVVSFVAFRGFWNRVSPFFASRVYSVWNIPKPRLIVWGMAWDAFKDRPLLGWGSENFMYAFNKHFNPDVHTYEMSIFDRPHNKILDLLVAQGLFGLVSYLSLFGYIASKLIIAILKKRNSERDTLICAIVLGLFTAYFVQDLVLFEMPTSTVALFLLFALGYWVLHEQSHSVAAQLQENRVSAKKNTVVVKNGYANLPTQTGLPAHAGMIWLASALGILVLFVNAVVIPMQASRGVVDAARALTPNLPTQAGSQDYSAILQRAQQAYLGARTWDTFLNREVDIAFARRLRNFSTSDMSLSSQQPYQELTKTIVDNLRVDAVSHPLDYEAQVEMGGLLFEIEARAGLPAQAGVAYADMTAYQAFEKAVAIAPRREDAYQYMFLWSMQQGDRDGAKKNADILLELNPNIGPFWFYQAAYQAQWGTVALMHEYLAQSAQKGYDVRQHPGDWEMLASSLYVSGKYQAAMEEFLGLARLDGAPWNFTLRNYVRLLELYAKTGMRAPAHQAVIDLLSRMPSERVQEITQYLKDNHLYY